MTLSASLRRLHGINFPTVFLLALLQRTPFLRVAETAGEFALRVPAASLLKSAFAAAASLGAVHTLAGATQLSPGPVATTPNVATVGVAKIITFTVTGATVPPSSWTVSGPVPGMLFYNLNGTSTGIQSGLIKDSTIRLFGTPTASGSYTLSLTAWLNDNGTGDSLHYDYVVTVADSPAPVFTNQPSNVTAPSGGTALFSVTAVGTPSPTYQWKKNGAELAGRTSSILTLSSLTSADGGSYTCVATNSVGSAESNSATLTVTGGVSPPSISVPPSSTVAALGGSVTLSVSAAGGPGFQWRKSGTAIPGATTASLTLNNLSASAAGSYDVVATNAAGSVTSAAATLLINDGLANRVSNVAVRTTLAANQILIVGLTVQGGSRDILIRAAGPSLGALGVPGTMADPKLAVFNGSAQEAFNDNWDGAPAVSTASASVGAFPFTASNSLDAAVVRSIDGGRTVQVSGPASGNLIVEAYDIGTGNSPRLTNLSARNFVGTGNDILIAGFTVSGPGNKNLLIRAAGPSLGALGVLNTLVDPKLQLFTAATPAAKIGENDDYSPTLPALFASVGAFAFLPGAKDAALMVSLPAGGYTVQVSGSDGGTGDAIVEIYELP